MEMFVSGMKLQIKCVRSAHFEFQSVRQSNVNQTVGIFENCYATVPTAITFHIFPCLQFHVRLRGR